MNPNKIPFISADQMREVDRAMIHDYGITLLQMMENAGRNLARLAQQKFLNLDNKNPVVILAGSGGNGGGVLVCARYLQNWGYIPEIILNNSIEIFRGATRHQLDILIKSGLSVTVFDNLPNRIRPALIIDGIIGYSLKGKASGTAAKMIKWANSRNSAILSLDLPSGIDATNGWLFDPAIHASATMTLALPKSGLAEVKARRYTGELYLADIGVPPQIYRSMGLQIPETVYFSKKDIIRIW